MKRISALFLVSLFVLSTLLTGCGEKNDNPSSPSITPTKSADKDIKNEPTITKVPDDHVINVYCPTEDVAKMILKYKELHPDFDYDVKEFTFATADISFTTALDESLAAGGENTPDIYCADSINVMKYTQGDVAEYATPYKDLGIDVDNLVKEADIAPYIIDKGTSKDGKLLSLGYEGDGGAFIYRRSIAKKVWGTGDPEAIKDKIGSGWDKFFKAAADLKAKGYGIVSGDGDIWLSIANSADTPWVVDGKLNIDPKREAFFDYAKQLKDKGYSNNTQDWTDPWYDDMKGAGKKKIFGFFGPQWLISYTLMDHSGGDKVGKGTYGDWAVCEPPVGFAQGGNWVFVNKNSNNKDVLGDVVKWMTLDSSQTGLQYFLANGMLDFSNGVKTTVASGTVMKNTENKLDFLGGQNMFEVYDKAAKLANGKVSTEFDEGINFYWREQVREFTSGKKIKEQAMEDFKKNVKENLKIEVE